MSMASSNYWYIYDRSNFNDYAMDSLEREEIINLYLSAGSIPCIEQFTETLED